MIESEDRPPDQRDTFCPPFGGLAVVSKRHHGAKHVMRAGVLGTGREFADQSHVWSVWRSGRECRTGYRRDMASGSATRGRGSASASRRSQRSTKGASSAKGKSSARSTAGKTSGRTAASRKPPAKRSRSSGGALVKALRGTWALVARGVGGLARAVGRTRELDPEHRRDGVALGLIALAFIAAVGVGWEAAGPVGEWVAVGTRSVIGAAAVGLPVALLVAAVVLMRSQPRPETRPRMVVGGLLVGLAVLGLLHLISGRPQEHADQMYAGGWIGWFSGDLLARGVTSWVAVPLLVLVLLYGVVVFSGTL